MDRTRILGQATGIQWQGVDDQSQQSGSSMGGPLIIGAFRRGRVDKPMLVSLANLDAELGHDPDNPDYMTVIEILQQGVPSVQVLRVMLSPYKRDNTNAHLVMFGYDYSNQNQYLYNADGSYNYDEYNNNIATIHDPQLKLTINGEFCPYDWNNQSFELDQWVQQRTYNAAAISGYQGDLTVPKERQDIAAAQQQYPNFGPLLYFNNLSGRTLQVDLEFRENHYYRVYSDDMNAVNKLSDTHYTICIKPYNPLPEITPQPGGSGGGNYIVMPFDMDNDIIPQILSTTPFLIDPGNGELMSINSGGYYTINYNRPLS